MLASTYGSVSRLVADILLSQGAEDTAFSFPQMKALKELTKTDEDTRLLPISPTIGRLNRESINLKIERLKPVAAPEIRKVQAEHKDEELHSFTTNVYRAFLEGKDSQLHEAQIMLENTIVSFLESQSSISTSAKQYFFYTFPFVLLAVAMNMDVSLIQILAENGADLNVTLHKREHGTELYDFTYKWSPALDGIPALVCAIEPGSSRHLSIPDDALLIYVAKLLELGADPNLENPLTKALKLKGIIIPTRTRDLKADSLLKLVQSLLRFGADPNKQDGSLAMAVELALFVPFDQETEDAERKAYQILTLLVENGRPFSTGQMDDALNSIRIYMQQTNFKQERTWEWISEKKPVPDPVKFERRVNRVLNVLSLLIQNGADLKGESGLDLLLVAAYKDQTDIANMLLDSGVDINAYSSPYTSSSIVSIEEHIRRRKDPVLNVKQTALMVAAKVLVNYVPNQDMVELLLRRGADPELKNGKGETALDLARKRIWDRVHYLEARIGHTTNPTILMNLHVELETVKNHPTEQLLLQASNLKRRKTSL